MEQFSLVPGTPVQQLIFPRGKADPLTGYEPNRPKSPRGQNNPYRAAPQAAPIRPPGISGDRVPFYSSLIYLDERIHRQVGQEEETAARRLYEVNQYNLYEERERIGFTSRTGRDPIRGGDLFTGQAAYATLGTRRSSCLYC